MNADSWWVEVGANLPDGKFIRNKVIRENEVNKFRFKHDNRGVFCTVYKYDSEMQNDSNVIADFYLDVDNDDINKAREDALIAINYMFHNYGIQPQYLKIYFSGKKGFHIMVPCAVFNIQPSKDLNKIYRMMAEDINNVTNHSSIDLKIYDKRRLFRLPNSIHPSTQLYKIPITYEEMSNCSTDDIREMAKEPRAIVTEEVKFIPTASAVFHSYRVRANMKKTPIRNDVVLNTNGYIPPCIQTLLDEPTREGGRNSSAAALASFYRQNGLSYEETIEKVQAWNRQRCEPCITDYEINTVMRSVYNGKYKMGCTWLNSVTDCNKIQCKIYKNRR